MRVYNKVVLVVAAVAAVACGGKNRLKQGAAESLAQVVADSVAVERPFVIDSTLISKIDVAQFREYGLTELEMLDPFVVLADEVPPYKPQGENIEDIGLNTIRFENWTSADWMSNNYIRAVRLYIDAYNLGLINNPEFDYYKHSMRGNFCVLAIEPFVMGGAYITIFFVDDSSFMLSFWVYSFVDIYSYKITGYEVRYTEAKSEGLNQTREQILQTLKLDPEQKLW